ncbi:MAG: SOS response-associated peptidase [Sporocytophaga sp.]|nr:SOS response-associated peptidase [Sporocytophaga sp.]
MCYHNSLKVQKHDLEKRYNSKIVEDFIPVYHSNGFSFQKWPVLVNGEGDSGSFQFMNWGLIPFWNKDKQKALEGRLNTLNCKGETAWEKPSFRASIKSKRCLIPSTGFYEWMHVGKEKIPFFIYLKNVEIFSFAGIFDECTIKDSQGNEEKFQTFSIITTCANGLMEKIHNSKKRMPVILSPEKEKLWVLEDTSKEEINNLLLPFPEEEMQAHTISKLITSRTENSNVPKVMDAFKYPEIS